MKRLITYITLVLLVCTMQNKASAQLRPVPFRESPRIFKPNNQRPQTFRKLDAVRNAYINKRLNLTPEEADRFWPVYTQYQSELSQVLRQRRLNNSTPTANGLDQVNRDIYYQQQIVAINKHYSVEFSRILPPEKVSLLYKSEREFKDELIHQLHERQDNNGN